MEPWNSSTSTSTIYSPTDDSNNEMKDTFERKNYNNSRHIGNCKEVILFGDIDGRTVV